MNNYHGCGSNICLIEKPNGIGTNGPCSCIRTIPTEKRIWIERKLMKLDKIKKIVKQSLKWESEYEDYVLSAMLEIEKILED